MSRSQTVGEMLSFLHKRHKSKNQKNLWYIRLHNDCADYSKLTHLTEGEALRIMRDLLEDRRITYGVEMFKHDIVQEGEGQYAQPR